jgi:hypothetical protein
VSLELIRCGNEAADGNGLPEGGCPSVMIGAESSCKGTGSQAINAGASDRTGEAQCSISRRLGCRHARRGAKGTRPHSGSLRLRIKPGSPWSL